MLVDPGEFPVRLALSAKAGTAGMAWLLLRIGDDLLALESVAGA